MAHVPENVLDYNKYSNPDGFGMAWREGNSIQQRRWSSGKDNYKAFRKLLLKIDAREVEYVAHFRKATHGDICREMSHPFTYRDAKVGQVLVFHNGIIDIPTKKGESDTAAFVRVVLSRMRARWWDSEAYSYLVEQSIGWSRMLIMTKNLTMKFNTKDWKLVDGIHYSTYPGPATVSTFGSGDYKAGKDGGGWRAPYSATSWTADEDDEYDHDSQFLLPANTRDLVYASGWKDRGHWVVPVSMESDTLNEDSSGDIECTNCNTVGEYYLIDGHLTVDIEHRAVDDDEPDEEAEIVSQFVN